MPHFFGLPLIQTLRVTSSMKMYEMERGVALRNQLETRILEAARRAASKILVSKHIAKPCRAQTKQCLTLGSASVEGKHVILKKFII